MSSAQNLAYSMIQVLHNFGAVAAVGGSLAAAGSTSANARVEFAWLAFAGWGTQVISGAAFGMVSLLFYQRLPEIAGVAAIALAVKIFCAATGLVLAAAYIFRGAGRTERKKVRLWQGASVLAAVALAAAAFLRWFA